MCEWEGGAEKDLGCELEAKKALFMIEIQRIVFLLSLSLGPCYSSLEIQGVKQPI